jgi:hypothetical protein
MGELITSFSKLDRFASLVLKHNEFYFDSLNAICPIIQRPMGKELTELRLVSCKTFPGVIEQMLDNMIEGCNLTKLGLVQVHL